MNRSGQVALVAAVGAVAIGGTALWAADTNAVNRCAEKTNPVADTSPVKLSRAERTKAVRIAMADPLVQAALRGERLHETKTLGPDAGYYVEPTVFVNREHLGRSVGIDFVRATPIAAGTYTWRTLGEEYRNGCFGDGVRTTWTQDYAGDSSFLTPSGSRTFLAEVSIDRNRVLQMTPTGGNFSRMRPAGKRDVLYYEE